MQNNKKYEQLIKRAKEKIKELSSQLEEKSENGDIAILGYSCRFPGGADNPEKYWDLLCQGYDAVTDIPKERFDVMEYYNPKRGVVGKTYTKSASFLTCDIKGFDNNHFEMSKVEATSIDPQYRMLLEVTWEALENAGIDINKAKGSKTGVFIGLISSEYGMSELASDSPYNITPYSLMGNYINSASGRISYYFDFKGPSMAIDTACSSSLTALNEAVIALRTHQCDMAIVGGANLMLTPNGFIGLSQVEAISADGRCRAFDSAASGYGRSEGCGVIVLKRLTDAQRDNNIIQAVVKGISVMHGGKSNGFFAPNGKQEQAVMARALSESGLNINDVDYIEAHGTGTVLGDAIEAKAIHEVYGNRNENLLIGSVKSNLGHMEAAAGMASLIKVLLSLKNHQIPKSIHYKNPNKECDFKGIQVADFLMEWKKAEKLRAAGISSFGISGTLSHVIIQEYDEKTKSASPEYENLGRLVTFSAQNKKALLAYLREISKELEAGNLKTDLKNLSYVSNKTRSSLNFRFASIVDSIGELKTILKEIEKDETKLTGYYGDKSINIDDCRLVFMPFQSDSLLNNDDIKLIMASSNAFRNTLIDFDNRYLELEHVSIFNQIYGHTRDEEARCNIMLQVAVQVAYYNMLKSILPEFGDMVAFGIGKLSLEYIKGTISFDTVTKIAVALDKQNKGLLIEAIEQAGAKNVLSAEDCLELAMEAEVLEGDLLSENNEKISSWWKLSIVIGEAEKKENTVVLNGGKEHFLSALKTIYLKGLHLDWNRVDDVYLYPIAEQPILPGYCFDRKTCWRNLVFFGGSSGRQDLSEKKSQSVEAVNNFENLRDGLIEQAANVSGLSEEDIETDRSLTVYGFESLSFYKISMQIEQHYGVSIEPKEFYESLNSIDKICDFVKTNEKEGEKGKQVEETVSEIVEETEYPMSTMQARIFSECEMNDKGLYDLVGAYYIEGDFDIDRLEECANEQLKRHRVLSASLYMNHGEFCMKYLSDCHMKIKKLTQTKYDDINEFVRENLCTFDMKNPPLMEILFIYTADQKKLLVFHFHHAIADGVSMNLYAMEILKMYNYNLPEKVSAQYGDYALMEKEYFLSEKYLKQKKFWKESLQDVVLNLSLPYDISNEEVSLAGASVLSVVDQKTVSKIRRFCADNNATPFMFFQACIGLLLHRLSFEDHIAIAVPVSCRKNQFIESFGMFTNTIAICTHYNREDTFKQVLSEVKKNYSSFMENMEYPFNHLSEDLGISKGQSLNVMYVYEITNARSGFGTDGLMKPFEYESYKEPFDLNFECMEHDGVVDIHLRYKTALFSEERIQNIAAMLQSIVLYAIEESDKKVGDINLISEKERELLDQFARGERVDYPRCSIPEMFDEQVKEYGEATAVVDGNNSITYHDLREKSLHLAGVLHKLGIQQGDVVGLYFTPGIDMIQAILGVLYAGGVYLPIVNDCPKERMDYMLSDSEAVLLLTNTTIETNECRILSLEKTEKMEADNDYSNVAFDELAYIIYTSGTTGKPKGVMVEHGGVSNLREYFRQVHQINERDRVMQFANYAFDATLSEFSMSIFNGATLYIVPEDCRKDMERLADFIEKNEITISVLPPVVLSQLSIEKLKSFRTIITAGSETTVDIVQKYTELGIYSNDYGPTETTVCASFWKHKKGEPVGKRVPIGRPMCNKNIYILNGNALCNPGVRGEICIAGDGLARGYLGMPELTASKFTDCPFTEGKMYRSGDVGRWLPDGNIEYLGRIDQQIKLRGYRVELGEIEVAVGSMSKIDSCVARFVSDSKQGDEIVLYFVLKKENKVESGEIRKFLKDKLPEYMIPSRFMEMKDIPLNSNGKVDIKALPLAGECSNRSYEAPTNETEKEICRIMEEILQNAPVGVNDDFFEIGGHSLRTMALSNRISETFGCMINYRKIYDYATPKKLAGLIMNGVGESTETISKTLEKDNYSLGYAQKRIYSIAQMQPDGLAYNMPQILCFKGEVKVEKMKEAIQKIVDANSILRTSFQIVNGEPRQVIASKLTVVFEDIQDKSEELSVLMNRFVRPFDLSKAPLFRFAFLEKEDCTYMFADFHHIICDGISLLLFSNEFVARYNGEKVEENELQYVDYSQWMNGKDLTSQKEFWLKEFEELPNPLQIPEDYVRPKEMSYAGASLSFDLTKKVGDTLELYAKDNGLTPYVVFLSTLMILLQRYTGTENDVVIGSPISGRTKRESESMLGMFVNTIALRGKPSKDMTYQAFLEKMKDKCIDAYENQEYPFDKLVGDLSLGGDMSRNPLFDVMLAFQNNEQCMKTIPGVEASAISIDSHISKFDFTWNVEKRNSVYHIDLEYSTDIFRETTMRRMLKHFEFLLEQMLENPNQKLGEFSLILPEEKETIARINDTKTVLCNDTIPAMFEKQAILCNHENAIVDSKKQISYRQLSRVSNGLAQKLVQEGIKRGDFVAIMADKSIEYFAAVLAVLKAGACFVPIDPLLPLERIEYILSDCKPVKTLTFTSEKEIEKLEKVTKLELIDQWPVSDTQPDVKIDVHDIAYCIYTSGTTGKPKGVLLEHSGVETLREYFRTKQNVGASDRTLQFANYSFDASISEMTMGILTGACMYIVSDEIKNNFEKMSDFITTNSITAAIFPPQYAVNLKVSDMRLVITAGSESSFLVAKHCSEAGVYSNDYGPTEVTVCATYWKHSNEEMIPVRVPIGLPICNKQVYIMNGTTLCGCNIPGELCIGGIGLARGYLGKPELTGEKFVTNPFTNERIYRTGDMARMLPDGNIEFLGRIDNQVKIRGYRVELGEIEQVIRNQEGVEDCAVVVHKKEREVTDISAYVVLKEGVQLEKINQVAMKQLPDYMLPKFFIPMERIPYNRSGKVDATELPTPVVNAKEYEVPQNEVEEKICHIFENILSVEKVGRNDNFFELGGDSIKAIHVVSCLGNEGYQLSYHDMMMYKSASEIASHVTMEESETYGLEEVVGTVKQTPMLLQFKNWNLKKPAHFNQSLLLKVDAEAGEWIGKAYDCLCRQHDILRAVYREDSLVIREENSNQQKEIFCYLTDKQTDLLEYISSRCELIQKSFDLTEGPLMKMAYFKTPEDCYLFICIHHLIVDRLSWEILTRDLERIMVQLQEGKEPVLNPKTASILHWERYLQEYMKTKECCSQKQYWERVINKVKQWKFPNDGKSSGRESIELSLESSFTKTLFDSCNETFHTETEELMIAAIATAAKQSVELSEVALLIENNGRQKLHKNINLSHSIGWFTNTYPVILSCNGELRDVIISTKDTLREVFDGGMAYSLCYTDSINTKKCISFNYVGKLDGDSDHYVSFNQRIGQNDFAKENDFLAEIDINARVVDGKLTFILSFDLALHNKVTMQQFLENIIDSLKSITLLCSSSDEIVETRSDIAEKGIDQNEFDEILGMSFD